MKIPERIWICPSENPTKFEVMPEGLDGYWWETDNLITIPVIIAHKTGAFSKFLKEQEAKGKVIFFPTIISAKLDSILHRHGYTEALSEFGPQEQEMYKEKYCSGLGKDFRASLVMPKPTG